MYLVNPLLSLANILKQNFHQVHTEPLQNSLQLYKWPRELFCALHPGLMFTILNTLHFHSALFFTSVCSLPPHKSVLHATQNPRHVYFTTCNRVDCGIRLPFLLRSIQAKGDLGTDRVHLTSILLDMLFRFELKSHRSLVWLRKGKPARAVRHCMCCYVCILYNNIILLGRNQT